jgi:hypothetical protein
LPDPDPAGGAISPPRAVWTEEANIVHPIADPTSPKP